MASVRITNGFMELIDMFNQTSFQASQYRKHNGQAEKITSDAHIGDVYEIGTYNEVVSGTKNIIELTANELVARNWAEFV